MTAADVDILVIGAGQAGLSAGYHLRRLGLRPEQDFLIVDHAPGPGGAWQFRWPSLTLTTVNGVHDLPGMAFAEVLRPGSEHAEAATAVPEYYARYEQRFGLRVHRPTTVRVVCDRATPTTCPAESVDGLLHAETVPGASGETISPSAGKADRARRTSAETTGGSRSATPSLGGSPETDRTWAAEASRAAEARTAASSGSAIETAGAAMTSETPVATLRLRGLINATGTWDKPFIPYYPGAETFGGRQLHAHDYRTAEQFTGRHVVVVGAGISAVQLLDEISQVTTTTWTSRTEPRWRTDEFTREAGRRAVAMVEDRVRRGLPPRSVVSVTGLPVDDRIRAARARGAMEWHPMFTRIEPGGVRWADGSFQPADVILWATGFRSALDHLAPLRLRGPGGGITMTGRLATQVAADPRIHLLGYGPSASTIGANRAGRAAAVELTEYLDLRRP
ncbi:NAD(P)-binding domain-containing protein [Nocardia vaccinii]|uniref:NAD(P)-binding domain-containing protein n=1 Tax=Nocardia vaccinii TaxID=1822 RepID=UPI000A0573D0|nr:NAD(P)-binding domain-containing protein [Nocardia vaccinii]